MLNTTVQYETITAKIYWHSNVTKIVSKHSDQYGPLLILQVMAMYYVDSYPSFIHY